MKKEYDIIILGSGPAGIHAASICAGQASIALVDMARSPGGRVLKQVEDGIHLKHTTAAEGKAAAALGGVFENAAQGIDYYAGSTLADINEKTVILDGPQGQRLLAGRALILAPGALEAPALFKNWTAPGIYTLGAYNSMIKRGLPLTQKVLVAGSGPLLYAVAANVKMAGGKLAGLLDAASMGQNIGLGLSLFSGGYFDKIRVAIKAFGSLPGVKWKRRCRISAVEGEAGNFTVRTVIMDAGWNTVKPGPVFKAEAIAVSYGLHPNTDLSQRCSCRHAYDAESGVWLPELDDCLRASVPGIYVAGDGALIKGYEGAAVDGQLAALAALKDLGLARISESMIAVLQKKRRSSEKFAEVLSAVSEPGDGYFKELADDLTICRCEAITLADIRKALAEGARDRNGVKKRSRLGMGHCQGRYCGQVIDRILARLDACRHIPAEFGPRTPAMPLRIGVIAGEEMPVDDEFRL